ncbi:MAG: hypothetical protein Q7R33_03440, partial [Nitrosarchaeum sp.]|nr:hypothetical protein [Nitrosarchaeum sp.]
MKLETIQELGKLADELDNERSISKRGKVIGEIIRTYGESLIIAHNKLDVAIKRNYRNVVFKIESNIKDMILLLVLLSEETQYEWPKHYDLWLRKIYVELAENLFDTFNLKGKEKRDVK